MTDDECDKKRNTYRLRSPNNKDLPFFAYDVFKPGEVAYSRIKDCIDEEKSIMDYSVNHPLNILNGVPFLFKTRSSYYLTRGSLFYFKRDNVDEAYEIISETKSKKLYKWNKIYDGHVEMNVLVGKEDILQVDNYENRYEYLGKRDPMIINVIYTIWKNVSRILNARFSDDNFFNIQMNYIMLWSTIDRYLVLRFGKRDQQENLICWANEESFEKAVLKFADKNDKCPDVFSNEDFRTFKLDKNKPLCCIRYYYTIRCNVVHTGKSSYDDYDLLKHAIHELLLIYMYVLRDTFEDEWLFNDIFEDIEKFQMTQG